MVAVRNFCMSATPLHIAVKGLALCSALCLQAACPPALSSGALYASAASPASAQAEPDLPSWWTHWEKGPSFKSGFTQEGESAAFGKLARKGTILTAKGGRLRAEYDKGQTLIADGRTLVQYDPSTKTAQRFGLQEASLEWPLLRLLTDPAALLRAFRLEPLAGGKIRLIPKDRNGGHGATPEVLLSGRGRFLHSAEWTDPTGAKHVLTLTSPQILPDPGQAPFTFKAPAGTKWIH